MAFQDHKSVIKAIYTGSEFLESVVPGNEVGIVLESSSFYAEQGGQVLTFIWFKFASITYYSDNFRCNSEIQGVHLLQMILTIRKFVFENKMIFKLNYSV